MSKNQDVFLTRTPQHSPVKFSNSDTATDASATTGTLKTLCTAGADDTIVRMLSATSTDTVDRDAVIFLVDNAGNKYLLFAIKITAGAGASSSVKPVNLLDKTALPFLRTDQNGNNFILLKNGWTLQAGLLTAPASGKVITLNCTSEDY